MDSGNRKLQMTLLGIVLAAPFLVVASVVGAHITSLADNVRVDVLCVALALRQYRSKDCEWALRSSSKTEQVQGSKLSQRQH
jgi:hypothetical protein